jgi:hypothetical protein
MEAIVDSLVTTVFAISCVSVTVAWGALLAWGATRLVFG